MDPKTAMYIAQGIHGLAYGMILFLIASGLNIIFGMMGILNLAHASFFMLSAYFSYQFLFMTGNFWAALLLAPLTTAFFGILVERFLLRKVHASWPHGRVDLNSRSLSGDSGRGEDLLGHRESPGEDSSHSGRIDQYRRHGLPGVSAFRYWRWLSLVLAVMALLLYKTRLGKIVRAAVSDADMVAALGINTPLVFMLVFGIGTWLAGVAGVAIAPILTVFPGLSDQIGMDAFVVVVTGGLGSLSGAFVVAIIFGLLSSYGVQFFSQLAPVLMFLLMAIVLAIKPTGLFGERE